MMADRQPAKWLRFLYRIAAFLGVLLAAGCGGSSATPPSTVIPQSEPIEAPLGVMDLRGPDQLADQTSEADGIGGGLQTGADDAMSRANYPRDLRYHGGPVVQSVRSYNLYVNCPGSCWGSPGIFLRKLAGSQMIHLLDQYTGSSQNNRFTFAGSLLVTYPVRQNSLSPADVYAIVHAAGKRAGGGYGVVYHLFVPPGTNACIPNNTQCYSPDNAATWKFCGYHGYASYSDVAHVLFTVEPFQRVKTARASCYINGPSPNGPLVDSTASTLEHELFESVVNPDGPKHAAWFNDTFGEIGDICSPSSGQATGLANIAGTYYGIQPEYTNAHHKCAFAL